KSGADSGLNLELIQNPDILATIAANFPQLTCVGFAAETQQLVAHAQAKLERKQVAMIVANDVSNSDIGFNSDDNQVYLVTTAGVKELPNLPKTQLARQLINHIAQLDK
ncbi:MAG: phosphopantothenoylcysteine decarboxylase, partial [Gammaproteobacteria bacterium]|nr:phosphopantothenoylcysteine decarboxylase [Gammaproteobacteria bacterium]